MDAFIRKARRLLPKKDKKHRIIAFGLNKKGNVISVGMNSYTKTHPKQKKYSLRCGNFYAEYLHAEISCLVKAKQPIYRIVIIRLNNRGETRLKTFSSFS